MLFLNAAAPTVIYTLSLHDALPIFQIHHTRGPGHHATMRRAILCAGLALLLLAGCSWLPGAGPSGSEVEAQAATGDQVDRKSTRLNSSHANISYAVFCLKKKIETKQ